MLQNALYLIPVPISDSDTAITIPRGTIDIALDIRHFIVEDLRTARRMLKRFSRDFPIGECEFFELNGHTDPKEIPSMLRPLREGKPMGVMSEAGCPAVADPGSDIVALAQKENFRVVPLVGPSSILLALMASGFNGQGFAFNGYLPIEDAARTRKIRDLESAAMKHHTTQIFIETPYRNDKMLACLIATLHPSTLLCVACNLTADDEYVKTKTIAEWKKEFPKLGKKPALYLIHSK